MLFYFLFDQFGQFDRLQSFNRNISRCRWNSRCGSGPPWKGTSRRWYTLLKESILSAILHWRTDCATQQNSHRKEAAPADHQHPIHIRTHTCVRFAGTRTCARAGRFTDSDLFLDESTSVCIELVMDIMVFWIIVIFVVY